MSKSFVSRILFSSLVALIVSIDAHALHYCPTTSGNATVCRGTTSSSVSGTSANALLRGCLNGTKYNVINDSTGSTVSGAFWATCTNCDVDNGFTKVSASIPILKTPLAGSAPAAYETGGVTYTGYVCCGYFGNTTTGDIMSPSGYYGYVGSRYTTTYSKAWTATTECNSYYGTTPPNKYSCSCVTGFTSSTNGTTSTNCNCVMANGYVCHATDCGAGRYISDDGQTCELCPTGNSQGITSGTSTNVSIPGQTLGVASSIDGCYLNANTEYQDANGNKFNYNAACYYNE